MYVKVDFYGSVSISNEGKSNVGMSKDGISALTIFGSLLDEEISGISMLGIAVGSAI